jgi:GNAT superfamily N-acetyltransferase
MDETEDLIRLTGRALVAQMGDVPGVELHLTRTGCLGLTGEPMADFNVLTLGRDPDAETFFDGSIARAKARGLPLMVMMSPNAAQDLAPVAARLGLIAAGSSPLMVLRGATPIPPGRPVKVTRALGPERVGIAGDLIAAAFGAPRAVIARCIEVGVTETAGFETYIAWDDDDGPAATVSVTPTGNTAGISLMATSPQRQRKGTGRALLTQVMADYRARGVERFHLGATPAGLPLYASLGFETIAELSVWVLPPPA